MDSRQRVQSLDVVRGFCVIAMMMVDWPGSWDVRFPLFEHARWLGLTPPDFIFPTFMFVMGAVLPLSLRWARAGGADSRVHARIARRAALLMALGFFLNLVCYCPQTWWPIDWAHVRIPGVLQRFAVVYPIAAIAYLRLSQRRLAMLTAAILIVYWIALAAVPVPGFGWPDLGRYPEGEVTPNLAVWLDRAVFGQHVYSYPYDPEGIASAFGSIPTTLAGVLAGQWLFNNIRPREQLLNGLFVGAVASIAGGYLWNVAYPISKKLWTGSFVLLTAGWAAAFVGVAFFALDIARPPSPRRRRWAELVLALPRWYGSNAVAAIVAFTVIDAIISRIPAGVHGDGAIVYLKDRQFEWLCRIMSARNASWVYSALAILLLSLPFRTLYRRRWFLRV